ncbi:NACHT domain- and WD repeat-containing protein 1-like isoform X2 [Clavelina lepadiformis]|uniref:NACHT domain- and WD repeat-containing protein 1-like isoform X2 n=1 Tax=Clavelina lepadiformis TaxID=159417 RepID=UPI0040432574
MHKQVKSSAEKLKLFRGEEVDLRKLEQTNVIRIFLSSTFSDMAVERNLLLEKAYPALRSFCQRIGLDFQVMDMRWGIQDNATVDHSTCELCLLEIKACKRLSMGPFFVAFLGNRYGFRPIPAVISVLDFEKICEVSKTAGISGAHLLHQWYIRDDNVVPPAYILQPITSIYPYFDDQDTANESRRNSDRQKWFETSQTLSNLIHGCVEEAIRQNHFTETEVKHYFKSVTEQEIEEGLQSTDSNKAIFMYRREIVDIQDNITDREAQKYIDLKEAGKVDTEAQSLLNAMKKGIEKLSGFAANNIKIYRINWLSHQGISTECESHANYLQTFCNDFVNDMKSAISQLLDVSEKHVQETAHNKNKLEPVSNDDTDWLFEEVAHQASFAHAKCQSFCGREALIDKIMEKLYHETCRQPVVIFGSSGKGKTALMAMILKYCRKRSPNDYLIYRFLGTSPNSSHIHNVLQTVIIQICEAYKLTIPAFHTLQNFNTLVQRFIELLDQISNKVQNVDPNEKRNLVIVLDSLDQLSPLEGAHKLNWLPKHLPPHVRILLSTLPGQEFGILDVLKRSLPSSNFIEVQDLDKSTGQEILDTWLRNAKRSLTNEQHNFVMNAFLSAPQPLFLKLAFDEARRWNSYTDTTNLQMATSVRGAISLLFDRLEKKHGEVFVSRAIAYLVATKNGITESELDDLLSLDDVVLDASYRYWSPHTNAVVRVPSLLWTRLKYDLGDYLVERQAVGHTVLALYHRQFVEEAEDRYLGENVRKFIHAAIADYFLGTWSDGKKKKLKLKIWQNEVHEADRKVASQPLKFEEKVYNFRKLDCLPYHLLHAEMWQQLRDFVMSDATWILNKINAFSIRDVLEDYNMVLERKNEIDIVLIRDALKLAKPTLEFPGGIRNHLFSELFGRLAYFKDSYPSLIGKLVQSCSSILRRTPERTVIPLSGCFPPPGGPLRTTLTGFRSAVTCLSRANSNSIMAAGSLEGLLVVWEVGSDEIIHNIRAHGQKVSCITVSDYRLASGSLDNTLYIMNLDTGSKVAVIEEDHSGYNVHASLNLAQDGTTLVSGCGVQINVWNISNLQCTVSIMEDHSGPLSCDICLLNNENVIAGYESGAMKWWSITTCQKLHEDKAGAGADEARVNPVIANYVRNNNVITCWQSGDIRIYAEDGSISKKFKVKQPYDVSSLSLDGQYIAFAQGTEIAIWSLFLEEMKYLGHLRYHHGVISSMEFDRNNALVVGSKDEEITIWDISNKAFNDFNRPVHIIKGMGAPVTYLSVHNGIIASASKEVFYVKLWNLQKNKLVKEPITFPFEVGNNTISPCGRYLAYLDTVTSEIVFHDLTSPRFEKSTSVALKNLQNEEMTPNLVIFSTSSDLVLTGTTTGVLFKVLNPCSKEKHKQAIPYEHVHLGSAKSSGSITNISVSHDGKRALAVVHCESIDWLHLVLCFEMTVEKSLSSKALDLDGHVTTTCVGNFSMGKLQCFLGTDRNIIYVLQLVQTKNPSTGPNLYKCTLEAILTEHESPLTALSLSHGQQYLFSGSLGRTRRLWHLQDGKWKLKRQLFFDSLLSSSVTCAAFTKDDKYVLSGSTERSLKLWNISTGEISAAQYVYSSVTGLTVIDDTKIVATTKMGYIVIDSVSIGITAGVKAKKSAPQRPSKSLIKRLSSSRSQDTSHASSVCNII